MPVQASNVEFMTSYSSFNLVFTLANAENKSKASSQAINIVTADFEQGSNVSSIINLPTTLESGIYSLQFRYYQGSSARVSTPIECENGQLTVVGHLARYNTPFTINDVTTAIDWLLTGEKPGLTIGDITDLIDVLLSY